MEVTKASIALRQCIGWQMIEEAGCHSNATKASTSVVRLREARRDMSCVFQASHIEASSLSKWLDIRDYSTITSIQQSGRNQNW